jgi:hypothetical protein
MYIIRTVYSKSTCQAADVKKTNRKIVGVCVYVLNSVQHEQEKSNTDYRDMSAHSNEIKYEN